MNYPPTPEAMGWALFSKMKQKLNSDKKLIGTTSSPACTKPHVVCSKATVEHRTFTEKGEFIKSADFEMIWIDEHVNDNYNACDCLNDDEYFDYKLWEDMNTEMLYKKYLPNTRLFRGKNPNIIFHGGCLGCMSQRLHGFERCKGCQYFRGKWNNPDLKIDGEETAKTDADELRGLLGGQ